MALEKLKIIYISSIQLENTSGGSKVLYNHLIKHNDFEVLEINNNTIKYSKFVVYLRRKFNKTRIFKYIEYFQLIFMRFLVQKKTIKKIKRNKPDFIVTVAHGELFWYACFAAKKLNIPLVSFFHDWWPTFFDQENKSPAFIRKVQNKRFLTLYKESAINFCVSEGMKAKLGKHPCAKVLFPYTGFPIRKAHATSHSETLTITYAGNISQDYGKMLRELADTVPKEINLQIIGNPEDWEDFEIEKLIKANILSFPLPEDKLFEKLNDSAVLLILSSFNQNLKQTMSTNFPSKLILYSAFEKPIYMWGPEYAEGIKLLKNEDCGICLSNYNINDFWEILLSIKNQPKIYNYYAKKSIRLYDDFFCPENIHSTFVGELNNFLLAKHSK